MAWNLPIVLSLTAPPCLNRGLNGLGDCADYPTPPYRHFTAPPRHPCVPVLSAPPQALSPSKRQEVRGEIAPPPYRRFIVPIRYILRMSYHHHP